MTVTNIATPRQTAPALRVQRFQAATIGDAARAVEQALAQHNGAPETRARVYVTRARGIWTVRAVSLI